VTIQGYYLDEDVADRHLAEGLRRIGIIVRVPTDLGMIGAADEQHLGLASQLGLVLVTGNLADYSRLHVEWHATGRTHAGLVFVIQRQASLSSRVRGLRRLAQERTDEEMAGGLEYLSQWL
jgi:hypothetical protein